MDTNAAIRKRSAICSIELPIILWSQHRIFDETQGVRLSLGVSKAHTGGLCR